MAKRTLAEVVERFASATHGWSDATLEETWQWQTHERGVRGTFFQVYEELCKLATSTATARAEGGPTMTTAQRVLAQHQMAYRELLAALIGVDDELLDAPPAEGEWPPRKVLEHIITVEAMFFAVTQHALEGGRRGEPPRKIKRPEMEAPVGGFDEFRQAIGSASLADILGRYEALHRRVLQELADIREDKLDTPSLWWEGRELPVQFRLHRLHSHLRQHRIQAEKTLDALGYQLTEVRQLLRMIYGALAEVEGAVIGAGEVAVEECDALAAEIAEYTDEMVAQVQDHD
jgi:uncharacterized damage-inducible protein DinB